MDPPILTAQSPIEHSASSTSGAVMTTEQQKSRVYYLQNKDRFIEHAQRWRREHPDEARRYQAEYYQKNKHSHKYVLRQQQKNLQRQKEAEERAKKKAEEKTKREEEERQAQPLPLVIEKPPTSSVDTPLSASAFTVKFL